ncbi:WD40 repeat-like protein [Hypoxylon sp. FL1857]|nr:WD40 repeat-like protein [Hypoxylon sp. FL1857]
MSREPAVVGHLRREFVLDPITALAFYTSLADGEQYLLAGEDTDIKVYHVQTSRLCGQLSVLRAQSIHGIAVPPVEANRHSDLLILVWGGHSIKILSTDTIEALISGHGSKEHLTKGPAEVRASDWIFDGRISPFGDGRIVLLTAHNEVIQAHVDPDRSSLVFDSIRSPSRPILYSGNFFWASKDCVLVAAGTVFGEILVWKCYLGVPEEKQNCEVLFVFTGHEGSIFGVHLSPKIQTSTGETLRLLASCSDDRTIRVWDITERCEESGHRNQTLYESHISDARETGFGNNAEAAAHDSSSARCLAAAMGHASRIWQVEFPQDQPLFKTSNIIELFSFGEDATAQKWNLSLDVRSSGLDIARTTREVTANLTHQSTFSNHSGKHIWSHAMTSRNGDLVIATGGADGKVALIGSGIESSSPKAADESTVALLDKRQSVAWSLADVLRSSRPNDVTADSQDGSNGTPDSLASPPRSSKPKNAKEAFNRYTFISDRRLLAATNSGRIFIGAFEDELTWTELILPDEIGQIVFSHAFLGLSTANPMALIGTNNGDIYYYSESGTAALRLLTRVDGKVGDIFYLSDASVTSGSNYLHFLITILRSTSAVVIQVDPNTLTTKHIGVTLEQGFMVTAAALNQEHLVLGSRKGVITALKLGEDGKYSAAFTVEVHRDEAITSILPLESRGDQLHNYVLSTCRDGKYRIHEITRGANQPNAVMIHEALPPFVSSVEGAWFSDNGDGTKDLMLCGFRSKNFVVWNETQRHEVATVDCGGSSRSYAWAPLRAQPDGFRFVFTKAGQMYVFSQMVACHKTLKVGGHGREIKAVSASSRYVATAAEDTVIRIWEYDGDHSRLRCVAALEKHATGIQALKWYNNEYLFSSGGNEEFFVWKLNRLESNDFSGLAVVCEAVFPDRSEVGDARITDFDVTCAASDNDADDTYEFCISMVLSNSTLQTYAYSKQTGFRLVRRSTYTGACLTQIRHLGRDYILTAATDGHLAIYANTERSEEGADQENSAVVTTSIPVVTRLHQNTIKSLDVRQVAATTDGPSEYLVVTGGDDNALGVIHVSLPSTLQGGAAGATIKSKSIIRSAHAAAITGVAITHLEDDGVMVVSGSNDQRVKVWKLVGWQEREQDQKQRLRAQLLDERYSSVADAGDLGIFEGEGKDGEGEGQRKRVIVVGVGVEIWNLEV